MKTKHDASARYFDPERERDAARLRWRRRGVAAAAVLLFAAVCAAALGLSAVGRRPDAGGNSAPVAEEGPDPAEKPAAPPEEVTEQGCCPAGRSEFEDALAELLEANPEARDFVDGFQGVTEPDPELDLSGELTPGVIPYLSQLDPRWGRTDKAPPDGHSPISRIAESDEKCQRRGCVPGRR